VVAFLGGLLVIGLLRSPKPGEDLKELGGGLLLVAVLILVGATLGRLLWKIFSWVWS
jgi:hypothetical protein